MELKPDDIRLPGWYTWPFLALATPPGMARPVRSFWLASARPRTPWWLTIWPGGAPAFPGPASTPGEPIRLAEQALAKHPHNYDYLNTLGSALYRAGRLNPPWNASTKPCASRAWEAIRPTGSSSPWPITSWAMLRRQPGGDSGSRNGSIGTSSENEGAVPPLSLTWNEKLEIRLIHAEAEEVFKSKGG